MTTRAQRRDLAFSIDFEGYVEAMQESFPVAADVPRFEIEAELEANADRCLETLATHGVKGTYFILGWIAEKYPRIVARIADAGHEIGCHSFHHTRLFDMEPETVRKDLRRAKAALEDASGRSVRGFRAPDFSLNKDDWVVGYLLELGFTYDSSSVPTHLHDVYGAGWNRAGVHSLSNGLVEFPIPTKTVLGRFPIPVGGGGYFRLFPFWLTHRWLATCDDPATYLHPYEIGGVFPRDIEMSFVRRFRHTYANGRLDRKLTRLFESFNAMPVAEYLARNHELADAAHVSSG